MIQSDFTKTNDKKTNGFKINYSVKQTFNTREGVFTGFNQPCKALCT